MVTRVVRKGKPVDASMRNRLKRCVDVEGDQRVASEVGVSSQTLARALAGLEVYGGTHGAIRGYLDRRTG